MRNIILFAAFVFIIAVLFLAWDIYSFASVTSRESADVAIVLGAAVWHRQPSPVFEERIKHGINLYKKDVVDVLIFTGGVGDDDVLAESEVARAYARQQGVPDENILIETDSKITYENLFEACRLMAAHDLQTALIVSDPLHMKRAVTIADDIGIEAQSSPTPTTRYQTWRSKSGQLVYEMFFNIVHVGSRALGQIETCSS